MISGLVVAADGSEASSPDGMETGAKDSGDGSKVDEKKWYEETFAREMRALDVAASGTEVTSPLSLNQLKNLERNASTLTKEIHQYVSRLGEFLQYAGDITASHAEAHENSASQTAAVVEASLSSAEELAYTVLSMKNMLCSLDPMEERVQSLIFQLAKFERLSRGIIQRAPNAK